MKCPFVSTKHFGFPAPNLLPTPAAAIMTVFFTDYKSFQIS